MSSVDIYAYDIEGNLMIRKRELEPGEKYYIHWGSKEYDKERFVQIRNKETYGLKPYGGLWASPCDASQSWKDWGDSEDFITYDEDDFFEFTLVPGSHILHIESMRDIYDLIKDGYAKRATSSYFECWMDFEKIKEEYDAIEVMISKDEDLYWALYGWDVDSILVLNPDAVQEIAR